jgi:tRNA nucleotidyltransferase/poly(A) polymerase
MPDYIYLLENRLSPDQRHALAQLREVAREAGLILFLTGDAVRDLTSGHAVRELEVTVHGNALKLKKAVEKVGGSVWGEHLPTQSLYLCFPGTVRIDLVSAHAVQYPKPGKAVIHPASIQEDLRRRDFTVNAMALSLNEGSYGLLMDPLNGVADIEAHTLRLVSNYGFLENPALLIRATRYRSRLGWELDPRTQTRYDNAREEGVIEFLSEHAVSQELEQIAHEADGLAVLRALETEGWMKNLFPAWSAAKADEEKLNALHELAAELLLQGVHADVSAAQSQLLTAKLAAKDLAALKKLLLRPGFVAEWDSLDALAAGFQKVLLAKENAAASAGYLLFTNYDPEAVLWLGFTSKNAAVQERFRLFLKVWPEERQRIPHALMAEMRITPELPEYLALVQKIFLELIDGKLTLPEEQRAFLEPFSPPAPPPPVSIKRTRVKRSVARIRVEDDADDEGADEDLPVDEDLDDLGDDDIELKLGKDDLEADEEPEEEAEEAEFEESEDTGSERQPKHAAKKNPAKAAGTRPAKSAASGKSVKPSNALPAERKKAAPKLAEKPTKAISEKSKSVAKPIPATKTKLALKSAGKQVAPAKSGAKAKPVVHSSVKPVAKAKPTTKPTKVVAKPKPSAKPVAKKVAAKPKKKH